VWDPVARGGLIFNWGGEVHDCLRWGGASIIGRVV